MTIAFFSNFLNHHQVNVADELYKMPGIDYFFVETVRMTQWLLNSGYPDLSDRPSIIKAWHCCPEKIYHKVGCSTEPATGTLTGVVG